jgi:uncharacterized membrane protein YbhN (UPF0104 family)
MATGGFGLFILLMLAIGAGLFFWLRSREGKRQAAGQTSLATWRLVLASVFGLVALFSGGCSLLFVPDAVNGNPYVDPMAILVTGGIPFAVAAFIVWLSLRRGNG